MEINNKEISSNAIRYFANDENGREIAHAYLYLIKNDLHNEPYGLIEDVYVDENYRGQKLGSLLVEKIIEEAKTRDCYKIICTSRREGRENVHGWYEKLGLKKYGYEFRMNLK
jgi:GNAT superfamily N-acetyltransferase